MNKELVGSLAWGGGIVGLALAATWARTQGFIDGDAATRIVLCATGLMIAWLGNRMPKAFVPSTRARLANRVAGWSLAVSGLVYAGLFAFAPIDVAVAVGCGAILIGMAITFGYCLSLRSRTGAA